MSVTFYIGALEEISGRIMPIDRCDCMTRWCRDADEADRLLEPAPSPYSCESCEAEINVSNANAANLLRWIGLDSEDLCGSMPAAEMAPLLRRRLWDEDRNHDPAIEAEEVAEPGSARVIHSGRRPGYIRGRCAELLALCERAGKWMIVWA